MEDEFASDSGDFDPLAASFDSAAHTGFAEPMDTQDFEDLSSNAAGFVNDTTGCSTAMPAAVAAPTPTAPTSAASSASSGADSKAASSSGHATRAGKRGRKRERSPPGPARLPRGDACKACRRMKMRCSGTRPCDRESC